LEKHLTDKKPKSMKANFLDLVTALALCSMARAGAQPCQYVTIQAGASYAVLTNQVITLVGYDWIFQPNVLGFFQNGAYTLLNPLASTSGVHGNSYPAPIATQMFTSLTNVQVQSTSSGNGSATLKIETPVVACVVSNYVPADAIVIPASVTGNVQIILESSQDLVNWTAANSGTYGASAGTNRFFRVRAAVNQ
jgi:hypothetical protein